MSKKVCIISTVDFTRMTVASGYTDYLKEKKIPFDIIYVDKFREKADDPFGARKTYGFVPDSKNEWGKVRKLIAFWKIRKYALRILEKNQYDFIIVWNELTAFIFSDILASKFEKKYCVNIRDYQYFSLFPVKIRLGKAIRKALFTTVSSKAYLEYLPSHNCHMMYSFNKGILEKARPHTSLQEQGKPIRILYIGQIAWLENVFKFMDALKNDPRFEMIFAGGGSEQAEQYAREHKIQNARFYGRFHPDETAKYLKEADMLYNLYGTDSKHLTTAVSIKFYYAAYLHIPILVYQGTEMERMAKQCGIGFSVKNIESSTYADNLYAWYYKLNQKEVNKKCESFFKNVAKGQREIYELIDKGVR